MKTEDMRREIDLIAFAEAVKSYRKEKGMSLRDVSEELKWASTSTLSRIENAKMVDLVTYVNICFWIGKGPSNFVKDKSTTPDQTLTAWGMAIDFITWKPDQSHLKIRKSLEEKIKIYATEVAQDALNRASDSPVLKLNGLTEEFNNEIRESITSTPIITE